MLHLDEGSSRCLVFTRKEGLLSAIAHDLQIQVGRFEIEIDETARTALGRFDATSLRVVCAMQGDAEAEGTLSAEQKREIESNIVRWVLDAERHPEARYVSTSIEDDGDGFRVAGELLLHGKQKAVNVTVTKELDRYVATARLHQPDFGIRPYSAMLGALKVKSDVEVRVLIPWPAGDTPAS